MNDVLARRTMRVAFCSLLSVAGASLPSRAEAAADDDAPARDFYRPHAPQILTAMTIGAGGRGANGGDRARTIAGADLSLRLDVTALSPLWLSAEGRVLVGRASPEPTLDVRAGYELAFYDVRDLGSPPRRDRFRALLRPFAGVRPMRFATSPPEALMATAYPLEAGVDWSIILRKRPGENRVWTGFIVGLYDTARREGGVELETTWGLGVSEQVIGGPFVGARFGYLPSLGASGGVHLGVHYEL